MSEQKYGGPAFPGTRQVWAEEKHTPGMTLRDYFAAKAMLGFLTSEYPRRIEGKWYAEAAYEWADAMLAAREKK